VVACNPDVCIAGLPSMSGRAHFPARSGATTGRRQREQAEIAEARYDAVLRRRISRAMYDELRMCKHMYGSDDVYAMRKQQISTLEIKR
jgi:hypothetical protein